MTYENDRERALRAAAGTEPDEAAREPDTMYTSSAGYVRDPDAYDPLAFGNAAPTQQEEWVWTDTGEAAPASDEPWRAPLREAGRPRTLISWFLAAVLGGLVGGGAMYVAERSDSAATGGGVVRVAPPVTNTGNVPSNPAAAVAKAVLPSIVRIDVRGTRGEGLGSGVIYRNDGYIITNEHVIEGADEIIVHLADGTSEIAVVVGTAAPTIDIALLKIARTGLDAATFGSASSLQVGDLAVAIGSPFGLDATVTAGVISALHRNESIGAGARFPDAIQTDAPINPGNSGGALANSRGEVIGINTAIAGSSGGNVGIGFAIPIDIVLKVSDQIVRTGRAQLPLLGIRGDSLPSGEGARIAAVEPGGPAVDAGLRTGDVIVALDGEKVTSMEVLISLIISKDVGQRVTIEYLRQGRQRSTTAVLAARSG